jgi:DNA-binding NtrC family response regulator
LMKFVKQKKEFDFNRFYEDLKHWGNRLNQKIIQETLEETYGNQIQAARLLGITPRALRYYLYKKD